MEILDFVIVVICGFGIGVLSGMFGIGGGGMIVPLLHSAFGLPIVAATATSLLTIAPTGISGSIKHIRQKTVSLKTGLILGGSGAVASVTSSLIADSLPEYLIVILTVIVILFSVGTMVRTLVKGRRLEKEAIQMEEKVLTVANDQALVSAAVKSQEVESPAKIEENKVTATVEAGKESAKPEEVEESAAAEQNDEPAEKKGIASLVLPLVIGLIAGGIAGIVGVGGGFIIVPFCVAFLGFSFKKAAGTSLVAISIIAIPGTISHALLGHIWWIYGLAIILGTIPGAQLGARLIAKLPERPMRLAFAVLLSVIGIFMLAQEFIF